VTLLLFLYSEYAIQIATAEDHWGCRGSTWSEDQSEVTFHDITVSPTSLARYSNEKQLLHEIAVSPNSLELSIDCGAAIWLEAMEKGQHVVATWRNLDQL
jgi:hypothetical protein